jgi:hypothetical protein
VSGGHRGRWNDASAPKEPHAGTELVGRLEFYAEMCRTDAFYAAARVAFMLLYRHMKRLSLASLASVLTDEHRRTGTPLHLPTRVQRFCIRRGKCVNTIALAGEG